MGEGMRRVGDELIVVTDHAQDFPELVCVPSCGNSVSKRTFCRNWALPVADTLWSKNSTSHLPKMHFEGWTLRLRLLQSNEKLPQSDFLLLWGG